MSSSRHRGVSRGSGDRRRSRSRSRSRSSSDEDEDDYRAAGAFPAPSSSSSSSLRGRPWDESYHRRLSLRRLRCELCNVGADSADAMLRHLNGGPHLKEQQGYREDVCRRNAEAGGGGGRIGGRSSSSSSRGATEEDDLMPDMSDRQREWGLRYTRGAKGTKRDVETVRALKEEVDSKARARAAMDLGQYRYNQRDFYCEVCDVHVGTR